jgi:hypothetical protein
MVSVANLQNCSGDRKGPRRSFHQAFFSNFSDQIHLMDVVHMIHTHERESRDQISGDRNRRSKQLFAKLFRRSKRP